MLFRSRRLVSCPVLAGDPLEWRPHSASAGWLAAPVRLIYPSFLFTCSNVAPSWQEQSSTLPGSWAGEAKVWEGRQRRAALRLLAPPPDLRTAAIARGPVGAQTKPAPSSLPWLRPADPQPCVLPFHPKAADEKLSPTMGFNPEEVISQMVLSPQIGRASCRERVSSPV